MPEGAIFPTSDSKNFGGKTNQELEAMLDTLAEGGTLAPEPEAPPVEEAAPPEIPHAEEVPPETPVEAAPPADPEPDLDAIQKEIDKTEREELKAKYDALQVHSSRMAGELGYLKQQLKSAPATSEPYEPQTQGELDRLTQLEQRQAQYEASRVQEAVSQAVAQEIAKMDGQWTKDYEKELAPLIPDLKTKIEDAVKSQDPELARQSVRSYIAVAQLEATRANLQEKLRLGQERKAAATADLAKAKKAQAPSGTGSVSQPLPKPKSIAGMTIDEADAWLRANT